MTTTTTTTSTMKNGIVRCVSSPPRPENPSRQKFSHNTKDYFILLFSWRPKSVATGGRHWREKTLNFRLYFFSSCFCSILWAVPGTHTYNTALAISTKKTEKDFMKYLPLKWRRRYLLLCSLFSIVHFGAFEFHCSHRFSIQFFRNECECLSETPSNRSFVFWVRENGKLTPMWKWCRRIWRMSSKYGESTRLK